MCNMHADLMASLLQRALHTYIASFAIAIPAKRPTFPYTGNHNRADHLPGIYC